ARAVERTEPSRDPVLVVSQVARIARGLGAGRDVPVGVCVPGALDASRERALMVTNFPGWNGLSIRRMLEEAIGAPVAVENDANAYALGEGFADAGAARGMSDYVMVTLGTGIGGGVVTGGRLLTGAHGMAGELGHMVLGNDEPCGPGCGGRGHFEALCGADALERKAEAMGLGGLLPLENLWSLREGLAAPLWDFALEVFARGIASLVHVLDPELVIVGGGLRKGEGFMELLLARVPKYLAEPFRATLRVRSSALDTDAPVFGAAAAAIARAQGARFPREPGTNP
ncbi:MAG: ROK family protein, partial [Synergistaceae bacterium]|nr:ROK family protein [Synergistaceae bacterium]